MPRKAAKPEIRIITHQWGEIAPEAAEVSTTIIAYNPNPFILPVKRVVCDIFMAGVNVGHGEAEKFAFPFQLKRNLKTNLLGALKKKGPIKIAPFGENVPFKAVINSISADWGEVTEERTELNLSVVIYNDSPFAIPISEVLFSKALHCEILLNEILLGIGGRLARSYRLLPNSDTEVNATITLDNTLMGKMINSGIINKGGDIST